MQQQVEKVIQHNLEKTMGDDPRLSYSMGLFVIAKDTKNHRVKVGGLGSFGIGQLWGDMDERSEKRPGFDDAPDIDTDTHRARLHHLIGKVIVFEKSAKGYLSYCDEILAHYDADGNLLSFAEEDQKLNV